MLREAVSTPLASVARYRIWESVIFLICYSYYFEFYLFYFVSRKCSAVGSVWWLWEMVSLLLPWIDKARHFWTWRFPLSALSDDNLSWRFSWRCCFFFWPADVSAWHLAFVFVVCWTLVDNFDKTICHSACAWVFLAGLRHALNFFGWSEWLRVWNGFSIDDCWCR